MRTYLAVDIGASSGRHIVGQVENGKIQLTETYRFENGADERGGHLCWDMPRLFANVIAGMKVTRERGFTPDFMGIDTWAVDYVLLDAQNRILGDSVAYRDGRTQGMDALLERRMPFAELYRRTGIAKQPFNTVYQLMAQFREHPEHRAAARHFLMVPDYLNFLLTGRMQNEYTNASTTALLHARTRRWDEAVLDAAELPRALFADAPAMPATALSGVRGAPSFTPAVRAMVGFDAPVLLPATHDTGSAFIAVPAPDANAISLSSGTWSLLGVENPAPLTGEGSIAAGFTNEGGYGGTYRYLQNIMGLWILQCIRKELQNAYDFAALAELAQSASGYAGRVNVNDSRFLAPKSMLAELRAALREGGAPEPSGVAELLACVYHSLADCYAAAVHQLEGLTGRRYTSLCVVGGGSQNAVLNQLTADQTGLKVYAGPTEATALGNLMAQMLYGGEFASLQAARDAVRKSFDVLEYQSNHS
ncbi:MAG: rhamnulokinase family protein [Clostridia bacterium]